MGSHAQINCQPWNRGGAGEPPAPPAPPGNLFRRWPLPPAQVVGTSCAGGSDLLRRRSGEVQCLYPTACTRIGHARSADSAGRHERRPGMSNAPDPAGRSPLTKKSRGPSNEPRDLYEAARAAAPGAWAAPVPAGVLFRDMRRGAAQDSLAAPARAPGGAAYEAAVAAVAIAERPEGLFSEAMCAAAQERGRAGSADATSAACASALAEAAWRSADAAACPRLGVAADPHSERRWQGPAQGLDLLPRDCRRGVRAYNLRARGPRRGSTVF